MYSEVGGGKAEASQLPDKHILQLIIDILQRSTPFPFPKAVAVAVRSDQFFKIIIIIIICLKEMGSYSWDKPEFWEEASLLPSSLSL